MNDVALGLHNGHVTKAEEAKNLGGNGGGRGMLSGGKVVTVNVIVAEEMVKEDGGAFLDNFVGNVIFRQDHHVNRQVECLARTINGVCKFEVARSDGVVADVKGAITDFGISENVHVHHAAYVDVLHKGVAVDFDPEITVWAVVKVHQSNVMVSEHDIHGG